MPTDRAINTSVGCLVSYTLWALAILGMGVGTVLDSFTLQNWGVVAAAGGGTATIRQYFVRQNRIIRNAFELGRDAARAEVGPGVPTPLRPR